jgi:hypothetical protein
MVAVLARLLTFGAEGGPRRQSRQWRSRCRGLFSDGSRAHSSAGERPLHTREVPGSIPGAPMASQAALRGSGRLRGGAWSVRWPAERRDTTRRGIWTTRAHLDVNTFSLLPVDAESSLSVRGSGLAGRPLGECMSYRSRIEKRLATRVPFAFAASVPRSVLP